MWCKKINKLNIVIKIKMVINIISYIFLSIIFCYFMWDFKVFKTFQISVFSIYSFAISLFISDKFKLSDNKIIKILQKFVFINIILALIGLYLFQDLIFDTIYCDGDSSLPWPLHQASRSLGPAGLKQACLMQQWESDDENKNNKEETIATVKNKDVASVTSNIDGKNEEYYSFKVKKDIFENVLEKGKEVNMVGVKDVGLNLGVAALAGKAAAEAFKHTSGMAYAPRIVKVGATTLATPLGTKVGIEQGKVAMENKEMKNEIDVSKLDEIDKDGKIHLLIFVVHLYLLYQKKVKYL